MIHNNSLENAIRDLNSTTNKWFRKVDPKLLEGFLYK